MNLRVEICHLFLAVGLGILLILSGVVSAEERPALEHPAIKEVLAMTEAGLAPFVVKARIAEIDQIPELTGEDLAALKKLGVDDSILAELIKAAKARTKKAPTPSQEDPKKAAPAKAAPAAPPVKAPANAEPPRLSTDPPAPEPLPEGAGRIEISLSSRFDISYFEVVVDGVRVAEKGALLEGRSEPGQLLEPATMFSPTELGVVYSEVLPAGRHEVFVGFALSSVDNISENLAREYSREEYVSLGVRAAEKSATSGGWGPNRGVVCDLAEGQICSISALLKKKGQRFGRGSAEYSIKYKVKRLTP